MTASPPSSSALVVFCTVPDEAVADDISRRLIDARLAACVNVTAPIRSYYRWKGEVHDDAELLLIIKTTTERLEACSAFISDAHPYDVPEIIALPVIAGSAPYLAWINEETQLISD